MENKASEKLESDRVRDDKGRVLPGVTLNPLGRGVHPFINELKAFDVERMDLAVRKISQYTFQELKEKIVACEKGGKEFDVYELTIAQIWAKSMQKGDHVRFEYFMSRLVGPMEKKIKITKQSDENMKKFLELPPEERKMILEQRKARLEELKNERDVTPTNPTGTGNSSV